MALVGMFLFVLGRFVDVPASVVFLVISHVGVVNREYFRKRRHETSTPRDVVASATTEAGLAVVVLMFVIVGGPFGVVALRSAWQ
ncbi:hypothetical protein DM2_2227 [Halorubrum sp. DM2]|nr:hypothetical protein [Halorubrum sp. DM2]VTT86189.1 hypothetical protein DM2_2227 [Halorubrum sp. DM2]